MPSEEWAINAIFRRAAGNNSQAGSSLRKFPQGESSSQFPISRLTQNPRCVGTGLRLLCRGGEVLPEEFGGGFEKVVGGDDAD